MNASKFRGEKPKGSTAAAMSLPRWDESFELKIAVSFNR